MAFVKLDCAILNSSLWPEKAQRDIFITALLMAEPKEILQAVPQIEITSLNHTGWSVPAGWYGFVNGAGIGIIHRAMVDREVGLLALEQLGSPDMSSKSQTFDGRRMVRVDGGFVILNFVAYREKDFTAAERSKRWRERIKQKQLDAERAAKKRANGKTIRPEHRADAKK